MSIPYLDVPGFSRRAVMPLADVTFVTTSSPGYIESRIAVRQQWIEARLRKRYASSLPFGGAPAQPIATGTTPPVVQFAGVPALGSLQIRIEVTTLGALGTALFRWSLDGGVTWAASGVATAASVVLGATGIVAQFADGSYANDNVYVASSPVPETILGWIAAMVTVDAYARRGRNPQDPAMKDVTDRFNEAIAEVKEAADSETGLLDLPINDKDAASSAVSAGGPFGYSEASPYAWTDCQAEAVRGG